MKLKEQMELKNRILSCSGEVVILSTFSGKIKDLNNIAAKIFGYRKNDLKGRHFGVLIPSLSARPDLKIYFPLGVVSIKRKFIAIKKNGSSFEAECRLNLYQETNGNGLIIFVRPECGESVMLKEMRQSVHKLLRHKQKIAEGHRELHDLAYVTTHHLQEPLRKIEVYCDLLKQVKSEKEKGDEEVSSVMNLARQARSMVENLQFYLEISTEELKPDQVDLNALVNEVMSETKDRVQNLNYLIDLYELPPIKADQEQLKLVFRQLADNAVRFKKEDGVLSISISGKHNQKEGNVTIFFRDNGLGFDSKDCMGIFKLFGRLNHSKKEGTGMGLAICRRIVERHGGQIKVKSGPGVGTLFALTLPCEVMM